MIDFLLSREKVPDFLVRASIRGRLAARLRSEYSLKPEKRKQKFEVLVSRMKNGGIPLPGRPEKDLLPVTFFQYVLGRHLNCGSGFWGEGAHFLDDAEDQMLALITARADLRDGQEILGLDCGWGALVFYLARKFPNSRVTAVSCVQSQREFIEAQAEKRKLANLTAVTADLAAFSSERKFDRVLSVEMFERVGDYSSALGRISGLLKDGGKLFVQNAAHRELCYPHDGKGRVEKHFFAGGLMPCADIFSYFPEHFSVAYHWNVPGTHYQKTCRAWLERLDEAGKETKMIMRETYGFSHFRRRRAYWRIFFMMCEEMFGYRGGAEWLVSHTLLEKR